MYGILKSTTNTGLDSELLATFSTPLTIHSNVTGYASDTVGLHRRANRTQVQRWELTTTIAPSDNATEFFVNNVTAAFDTPVPIRFPQMVIPGHGKASNGIRLSKKTPVGMDMDTYPDAPLLTVSGTFNPGASVIAAQDPGGLGRTHFMIGEFIQFTNHKKIYVVKACNADGTGLVLFPALRKQIVNGEPIIYGDRVTMMGYYDLDTAFGITYQDGILTDTGSVKFVESLT